MVSSYLTIKYCNNSGFTLRVLFLCHIKLETSCKTFYFFMAMLCFESLSISNGIQKTQQQNFYWRKMIFNYIHLPLRVGKKINHIQNVCLCAHVYNMRHLCYYRLESLLCSPRPSHPTPLIQFHLASGSALFNSWFLLLIRE